MFRWRTKLVVLSLFALGGPPVSGVKTDRGKPAVWMKGEWRAFEEDDPPDMPRPYPPKTDSYTRNDTTIMVSISSFRDYRCPKTLFNLFT